MFNEQNKKFFCKQNIPNLLLITRIIFVPIIVLLLLIHFHGWSIDKKIYSFHINFLNNQIDLTFSLFYIIAGILFCIASLTDFLDGYISRKYNWVSNFGKIWDPIADKILINSVLICFAAYKLIPIFIPIIMIMRDVIIDGQRMSIAKKNIIVPANLFGKTKTVLQIIGIILIFFFFNSKDTNKLWWWLIQNLTMFLALIASIVSGIIYIIQINKKQKCQKN